MENSGKAIESVSFTGWPDVRVIPLKRHRTGRPEHPAWTHPHMRDGRAYRGSAAPGQAARDAFAFRKPKAGKNARKLPLRRRFRPEDRLGRPVFGWAASAGTTPSA